jgi:hypothetical protein
MDNGAQAPTGFWPAGARRDVMKHDFPVCGFLLFGFSFHPGFDSASLLLLLALDSAFFLHSHFSST